MPTGILVLAEHADGKVKKSTFELLSKAASLGAGPVSAAVIGDVGTDFTAVLASFGATRVFYATGTELAKVQAGPYARALEAIVRQADPVAVLAPSSPLGKDIMPRVATRLGAGLAADCTDLKGGTRLSARRPMFAGKVFVDVEIPSGIQFFTVRPNSFPVGAADGGRTAESLHVAVSLSASDTRAQLLEVVKGATEKVDLTEADRIVAGGRSLGSADNFKVIEDVAEALGATVGASRAAVDAGYASHDMQVGQTGKTVNPTLYIAFGISGAIQHLAGMRSSKVIVAVNKDPEAPIFQVADYGMVADLFQAAPALARELRKLQG